MSSFKFLQLLFYSCCFIILANTTVIEVNSYNFNQTVSKMYFSILFVATNDCVQCDIEYPKFLAASQPFHSDPQIYFGHVTDSELIKSFGVTEYPSIVYYQPGSESPSISDQDHTVEGVITTIAKAMKGDFSRVKREYAAELVEENYDKIVSLPNVYSLILLYKNNEAKEDIAVFEKIAASFRNDFNIVFGKVNAEKEEALRSDNFLISDDNENKQIKFTPILRDFGSIICLLLKEEKEEEGFVIFISDIIIHLPY
ncbi:Hypothetical predicted protein [Octopus vulgaris]|uniref:Uncharacterized protein n=1 Tax=Octopus vulgaris TaxID=6645 RepID=A0AA36AV19_OCTVU|nr:Hypothetical predicted protein [Octopus vulgaris]